MLTLILHNLGVRVREWWSRSGYERACVSDLLDVGPRKYQITQPGKPFKAKRTWEHAMRTYIHSRHVA